ncbi:MAG TPA: hypothetical protein VIA10_06920 [Gaiellaceae bacterium]|jgi:hypothetical protein
MSLYREARTGRRRLWLALGAVAVVAAVIVGVVVATGGEPSPEEQLRALQEDVQPALAALELVPIHYESPNATTHAAAAVQLEVARETVAARRQELQTRDPAATAALVADLDALAALVRTTGRVQEVEQAARAASDELRGLVGLD